MITLICFVLRPDVFMKKVGKCQSGEQAEDSENLKSKTADDNSTVYGSCGKYHERIWRT